jgi:drug/metabolite transporter (DMT)-like permease
LSGERLRSDLTLLATAIFWGSAFVACRVAAEQLGPFLFNGSRFVLGALTLLPFVAPRLGGLSRSELVGGLVAGALLFSGSAVQQAGLQFTTAGKAGFITGLYVVLTPLFLAVIWRKWPGWMSWIAAGLAALGMYFLSALDQLTLSLGDALELVGAAIWALHVIAIDRFAGRADVLRLSLVQCVVCATLSLSVGLGFEARALPKLANVWWAIWYTGVFSVGLGYTLQILGQRHALPADASIILSSEAVFAALAGWLLLNETLTAWQLFGCALMLGGMLLAQARVFASPRQTPGLLPD